MATCFNKITSLFAATLFVTLFASQNVSAQPYGLDGHGNSGFSGSGFSGSGFGNPSFGNSGIGGFSQDTSNFGNSSPSSIGNIMPAISNPASSVNNIAIPLSNQTQQPAGYNIYPPAGGFLRRVVPTGGGNYNVYPSTGGLPERVVPSGGGSCAAKWQLFLQFYSCLCCTLSILPLMLDLSASSALLDLTKYYRLFDVLGSLIALGGVVYN